MLREATVPWSAEVEDLAESAIKINHTLSSEVYTHRNTAAKKLVLKKYGLPTNVDLSNVSSLKKKLNFILKGIFVKVFSVVPTLLWKVFLGIYLPP